jgi:hypothetical protein
MEDSLREFYVFNCCAQHSRTWIRFSVKHSPYLIRSDMRGLLEEMRAIAVFMSVYTGT